MNSCIFHQKRLNKNNNELNNKKNHNYNCNIKNVRVNIKNNFNIVKINKLKVV